ncbi:MAG TPA: hypothetical protein VGG33_04440 [Polyangia bacterium]
MTALRRSARIGFALVVGGLAVQVGASLFWGPGAFMILAAIGVPMVVIGTVCIWRGTRSEA